MRQVAVHRFVGRGGTGGRRSAKRIHDVEVVLHDRARGNPWDEVGELVPILRHVHDRVVVAGRSAVVQTSGIKVDDVGKVDVGFGFNQHVGRGFGKLHRAVLQIHVAEERDAVDGKPFDDGGGVGRAVQQVVVVVVRLQGIQQDIRVRLPLLTVAHRGLQAWEGIHEERHGHVPIGAQQQVRIVPRATNDFSVCVNLSHDVLGVNFGVFVVHANPILVVGVESFSDFCDVPERHGPKVRVPFVHGPVVEPVEV